MAVTSVTMGPQVYNRGGAWEESYAYTDAEVFAPGDLIRLTTSGTIKMADTASAGAVSGMALETGSTDGDVTRVLMFAPDTVLKMQTIDGEAPTDLTKGVAYALDVTSGSQAVTTTTTNGVAMVVGYAGTTQPWTDVTESFDETPGTDNNSVLIRFLAATLDGYAAA